MLKKAASSVLASLRGSTYPEGTPQVSTCLRPCWRAFWTSCTMWPFL